MTREEALALLAKHTVSNLVEHYTADGVIWRVTINRNGTPVMVSALDCIGASMVHRSPDPNKGINAIRDIHAELEEACACVTGVDGEALDFVLSFTINGSDLRNSAIGAARYRSGSAASLDNQA